MLANSKTITLPEPIERTSSKLKNITLAEPTVTSLHGLEITAVIRGDTAQLMILLPRISELTEAEVNKLTFKNIAFISMKVVSFLSD